MISSSAVLVALAVAVSLAACGGGPEVVSNGTGTGGNQAPGPSAAQVTAQKAYDGVPRTPVGFYADPPLNGVTGVVATSHLKNTDVTLLAVDAPRFELCTNDMAQAINWSEARATLPSGYSDMVDMASDARAFEMIRVPRSDLTSRIRHRVFKCSYLDRSGSDLAQDRGPAGVVAQKPIDSIGVRQLAEYLWQFTLFNNADHVVLSSDAATNATQIVSNIDMARLTRATIAGECDRIEVLRWTHTLDVATGAMQRRLDVTQTIRARLVNGSVQLCN